jgi:hypothetical protein
MVGERHMSFATAAARLAGPVLLAVIVAAPVLADTIKAAPDRLEFEYNADVAMAKDKLWARVLRPGAWWSNDHTYSGKAANMKLAAKAGGCWCEVWPGGEVEHGHVVYIAPGSVLRIEGALGPLQEMGVSGILAITLEPGADSDHTRLKLTYKVSGSSLLKLDTLSSVVDRVIGEQFATLSGAP